MDAEKPDELQYQRARFTTQLPRNYLYSASHYWIGRHDERTWRLGLTKFGSRMLGEMVDCGFELGLGAAVRPGQVVGWIEGFKALSDIVCIAEGHFQGANPALEEDLTLVNQDPFGAGWLYAVQGKPDATCVDVEGYVQILNATIDRLKGGTNALQS
jgi:glycine cleavage system H protein